MIKAFKIVTLVVIAAALIFLTVRVTGDSDTADTATGRTATYVIAASDAPGHLKAQADAVATGTGDNELIQKYLNMMVPGDSLLLSGGNFYFSDYSLNGYDAVSLIVDNITLAGMGKYATKLNLGNNVNFNVIGAEGRSGVEIRDLEVNGNKANNHQFGGPTDDRVQNGIYMGRSSRSTVTNTYVHDAIFHGIFNPWGTKNRFVGNEIAYNRYMPIHAHNNADYNYYGQNYIHENGMPSEGTWGGLVVVFKGSSGNIIDGNTIVDEYGGPGINISADLDDDGIESQDNIVANNYVRVPAGNDYGAIHLEGQYGRLNRTTITGNTLVAINGRGIVLAGTIRSTVVTGNTIEAPAGGIFPLAGSAVLGFQFSNNRIHSGVAEPIRFLQGSEIILNNNWISSNDGLWTGIRLKNVTNSIIDGNRIHDVGYAIDEATDGGNSGNIIVNNLATQTRTPAFFLQSTNVSGNIP